MTLLLTNEEIVSMMDWRENVDALERAYRELAEGEAVYRRRSHTHVHTRDPQRIYRVKTMEGAIPSEGIYAIRLTSDVLSWPEVGGKIRQIKLPALPGDRWLGLVLLFSVENGELLAILQDGELQRMRVGAASGLAARYLAPEDAGTIGIIGSGWQAGAQLLHLCSVRPIEKVHVWSPTESNRTTFAEHMSEMLGLPVVAAERAEDVFDSDMLVSSTNAMSAVYDWRWVRPGMHITSTKRWEVPDEAFTGSDRVIVNTRDGKGDNYWTGPIGDHNALELAEETGRKKFRWAEFTDLPELVLNPEKGRQDGREITFFMNNVGLGIQFAALGALILRRARDRGVGRELPLDWFTQNVSS